MGRGGETVPGTLYITKDPNDYKAGSQHWFGAEIYYFAFLLLFVSLGSFLEVRLFYFHYIPRYHNYLK
jgi:hypothetical protein